MKRTLAVIASSAALLAAGCSSGAADEQLTTVPAIQSTSEPTGPPTNARGAITAELGSPVTIPGVVDISDTSLDAEGCSANEVRPGEIAKRALTATVKIYDVEQIEWLWPSDFDYVDAEGKIARNFDTSDANPCAGGQKVIDLPPNSSADARVTLDIPLAAVAIGYSLSVEDTEQRIEWAIPDGLLAATEQTPVGTAPASTVEAPAPQPAAEAPPGPPNPYPNSNDSFGRPSGSSEAEFVECAGPNYQKGTGVYSDGSMDYASQCAG